MKKLYFLLLLGTIACTRQPADHFILRGTIPGAMDSTKVTLRTVTRWDKDLASAYIIDGKFELRGQLHTPTLCKFSLSNVDHILRSGQNQELARCYELDFFVENGKLTFTTPHIDSLPQAFGLYDIRKEKNYQVKGSPAQEAYHRIPATNPSIALRHTRTPQTRKSNSGLQQPHGKYAGGIRQSKPDIYPQQ